MITSILNKKDLENHFTLGAEYYQPYFLKKVTRLVRSGYETKLLKDCCKLITDGDHSATNYTETGILYLLSESIKEGYIDTTVHRYISKSTHESLKRSQLKPRDVLLTKTGVYFGKSAVIPEGFPEANTIAHVARIVVKEKIVNPYFLSAYFNSIYGYSQLRRRGIKASRPEIKLVEFWDIIIPLPSTNFQILIESLIKKANKIVTKSMKLYNEAQHLLLVELGLHDWRSVHQRAFVRSSFDIRRSGRIDAEYFQPKYEEIEKYLTEKFDAKPIGDLKYISVTTGQYSELYIDKIHGKPYIRGVDITNGTISTESLLYIPTKKQLPSKKAREGDVIITRVGTIGLSARIPKECEGGTISDNLIRLRFQQKELDSYYLALYLGSPLGVNLMIKNSRGSVQQRLNQETLKDVIIPLLPREKQNKLSISVQEAHKMRVQSKQLFTIARRAVEIAIERDEAIAEKWITEEIAKIGLDSKEVFRKK